MTIVKKSFSIKREIEGEFYEGFAFCCFVIDGDRLFKLGFDWVFPV